MTRFVVARGPLLSDVTMPALAGLLIFAGFLALKPKELARSWQTSLATGAAALITMVARLIVPIHVALPRRCATPAAARPDFAVACWSACESGAAE